MAQCPVHNKDLKSGQYGEYCATKLEDGTWCKYKPGKPGQFQAPALATSNRPQLTAEQRRAWSRAKDYQIGMQGLLQAAINSGSIKVGEVNDATLEAVYKAFENLRAFADKKAGYDRAADAPTSVDTASAFETDEIDVSEIPF